MNITATAVAVTLAVVIAVAFLFLGPNVLRPFQPQASAEQSSNEPMATSTDELGAVPPLGNNGGSQAAALPQQLPTELSIKDTVVGTGAEAMSGDSVTVNYVGMLPDGTVFDASAKHGQAFTFQLGAGQVIKGWDKGVAGMKVGGKRQLIIPPADGYGAQGAGNIIPPNATLIFDVELVKVGQ